MIKTREITEIYPKIFHIKLPLPLEVREVNAYLFTGEIPTIIDCGAETAKSFEALKTLMKKTGVQRIARILPTHFHMDHVGIASVLAAEGTEIFTNPIDYEEWTTYANKDSFAILHGWMTEDWSVPEEKMQILRDNHYYYKTLFALPPIVSLDQPGDYIQAGDYRLQIISTPGHTRGHVSYWLEKEKLIFSGDVLLPDQIAYPETWLVGKTRVSGLLSYINSIKKLESLGGERYFPGHGVIGNDPTPRCRTLLKQIKKQVTRHVPAKDVYSGTFRLCEKFGSNFLLFHLHHVFGWEYVQEQLKKGFVF